MKAPTPAERILVELGISEPKDIDLEAIACCRKAMVRYRPLCGCEAMIVGTTRNAVITVNSQSGPERRRFSIAHELGHWHHHRGQELFCSAGDIGDRRRDALHPERQADDFASDLILPDFMVRPLAMKIKKVTIAAADDIAGEFTASRTATLIKLAQLDRFPIMLVCHDRTGLRWFSPHGRFERWWWPTKRLDSQTYAYEMLFNGSDDGNPHKMPADAWFDFKGADRQEITEQSFRLWGEQVLSILTLPERAIA